MPSHDIKYIPVFIWPHSHGCRDPYTVNGCLVFLQLAPPGGVYRQPMILYGDAGAPWTQSLILIWQACSCGWTSLSEDSQTLINIPIAVKKQKQSDFKSNIFLLRAEYITVIWWRNVIIMIFYFKTICDRAMLCHFLEWGSGLGFPEKKHTNVLAL